MDERVRQEMLSLLPRMRRFALGMTGSADEADDLVQATYERAIRYIGQWQDGTRLDSWMYRIARNLHLNTLRARRVRGEHLQPVDLDKHLHVDGNRVAESKMTLGAVRDFVHRLPEEQRTALLLVCVEGLSYKDAADALDLPIGTVTSRIARARTALRQFVEGAPELGRGT